MIFSVFDHNARQFNYYEAPGTSKNYGARGTRYRLPTQPPQGSPQLGNIGFAPEALALALPLDARFVGCGKQARGIIANTQQRNGPHPALPGRYEEDGGTINGLGGLGDDSVVEVQAPKYPFGTMVAAACIAAVVGVVVQKILK